MAEVLSSFQMSPGGEAPQFSLADAFGKLVTLKEAAGQCELLVLFACNHCPFVVHLATEVGNFAREMAALGVHTMAINSNDLARYPQDGPGLMKEFAAQYHWDFPYLLDESQAIAKAYGAQCTPDFFLFDGEGRLFYAGQFDESRPRRGQACDGRDMREAVRRMLASEPPIACPYPSSGCNIKWKPGNEPRA